MLEKPPTSQVLHIHRKHFGPTSSGNRALWLHPSKSESRP